MNNIPSFQSFQNLLQAGSRWLSSMTSGEEIDVAVSRKAPPRLSLARSFVEAEARPIEPNLSWFEGRR